ncbi:MAG: hypothetical protein AB1489_19520, partial [Acidobacteriota bacterium]
KKVSLSTGLYGLLLSVIDGDGDGGINIAKFAAIALPELILQLFSIPLLRTLPFYEYLRLAIELLNSLISKKKNNDWDLGWLSPALTAAIHLDDTIFFAQVGDTRAYLIRNDCINQITKDQTLIRQLIDDGHINEEEAKTHPYRNIMLQALGAQPKINVVISSVEIADGDIIFLCTRDVISDLQLQDILQVCRIENDIKLACDKLFELSKTKPVCNMTAMMVKIQGCGLILRFAPVTFK